MKTETGIFVRKSTKHNTARLEEQCKKQKEFKPTSKWAAPIVISDWNGQYFDMDYVAGLPLGVYLRTCSHLELQELIGNICGAIQSSLQQTTRRDVKLKDVQGFKLKISDLQDKLPASGLAREALDFVRQRTFTLLEGPNHGDFSYENILVDILTRKIWLLDFLPSPVETPLIDLGRILIDAEHGWWQSGTQTSASERIGGKLLAETLREIAGRFGINKEEVSSYKLLAALRIIPYTKTPMRKSILFEVLENEIYSHRRN
jgi:hypothetical protein